MKNKWLDFNDAPEQDVTQKLDVEEVKASYSGTIARVPGLAVSQRQKTRSEVCIGQCSGQERQEPGNGNLPTDFGTTLKAVKAVTSSASQQDTKSWMPSGDFPEIIQFMADWLGIPSFTPPAHCQPPGRI